MADLNRLSAVIDVIAHLPNTAEYLEARQIGEHLIQVIAEADIRSAGQKWQSYVDPAAEEGDDLDCGDNWQRVGDIAKRITANIRLQREN